MDLTSTESVPGVASWVNIPVSSFDNIQVPSFGHDIFSVPPIQNGGTEIMSPQSNYGYRENVWVNIPVPSFGNIQVPSFGQPIKCLKKSCQPISFFV